MKRGALAALVASAFLAVPGPVDAQEQAPEMTFFAVFTDHVKPSAAMEYEAGIKQLVESFTAAGVEDMQWVTISGPEMGYAYAIPGKGPADYNTMMADWQANVGKVGLDKFMGIMQETMKSVESQEMYYLVLRSDLSYKPEMVGFDPAKPLRHYTVLKYLPGTEMAAEANAKKWQELYEKHGIERGWRLYQYVTGGDLPAYMIVESAESEYDHHMMQDEINAKLGEEAMVLYKETGDILRGMDTMTGFVRPDLSFPPMEMASEGGE